MCGFTGFVRKSDTSNLTFELLRKMNLRIKHRGPDDEGYALFSESDFSVINTGVDSSNLPYLIEGGRMENPRLALAHRRLSIIDLSSQGHQPMSDESGRYWIAYNGEVFNYKAIRSKLKLEGVQFNSNTDTEVLLQAYICYGEEFVTELDGFFSFVLYDREEEVLFGARDFTGVKPFYYVNNAELFAFGSEVKCFYDIPGLDWTADNTAIKDFLVHGKTEVGKETFYKNVSQLLPGKSVKYDVKSKTLSIFSIKRKEGGNKTGNLKQQIQDSVKSRLMSDVPIGFALSGGIDSTLLGSLAKEDLGELKLFSSNSSHEVLDESNWQKIANDYIGGKWFKTNVDITMFDPETLGYIQDSPLLGANNLAHIQMVKTVQESGVKVLFNGQGADELFAGYPIYYAHYYLHASLKEKKELIAHLDNAPLDLAELRKLVLKLRLRFVMPRSLYERIILKRKSYSKYLNLKNSLNSPYIRREHSGSLKKALKEDYFGQRLREMLHWEDRNTMWYGVESRNPFADDMVLASMALAQPNSMKIKNGWSKFFLRNAFKKNLPMEIVERKDKKGFSMPDMEWNRGWERMIADALNNEKLDAYIDRKAIGLDLKSLLASNDINMHQFLFRVMSLSSFLNIDKTKIYEMA